MAYFREVILELDPFRGDVVYQKIPIKKHNAFIERVFTRKTKGESPTPVAIVRDTGLPVATCKLDGVEWDTPYFITLIAIRKRGENTEIPDDAGRLLGVVSDPASSWFLCMRRTPPRERPPEQPSETAEPKAPASPEYDET